MDFMLTLKWISLVMNKRKRRKETIPFEWDANCSKARKSSY